MYLFELEKAELWTRNSTEEPWTLERKITTPGNPDFYLPYSQFSSDKKYFRILASFSWSPSPAEESEVSSPEYHCIYTSVYPVYQIPVKVLVLICGGAAFFFLYRRHKKIISPKRCSVSYAFSTCFRHCSEPTSKMLRISSVWLYLLFIASRIRSSASVRVARGQAMLIRWKPRPQSPKIFPLSSQSFALLIIRSFQFIDGKPRLAEIEPYEICSLQVDHLHARKLLLHILPCKFCICLHIGKHCLIPLLALIICRLACHQTHHTKLARSGCIELFPEFRTEFRVGDKDV